MGLNRKEYYKKYRSREDVKEKQRIYQANWRKRNPEKATAMSKRNWKRHKEKFNKKKREKQKKEIISLGLIKL